MFISFCTRSHASPVHFVVKTPFSSAVSFPSTCNPNFASNCCLKSSHTYFLNSFVILSSSGWTLIVVPSGTLISIVLHASIKPVLYIECLLSSMHVCIKNFAERFRSCWVVENVIRILFNTLLHDRLITPSLWFKKDLHFSIPLFFFHWIYPLPFITKD